MWGKIQRLLDRFESRLALWAALGGGGVTGGLTAWAAAATEWLNAYGPIAWVGAGFLGAFLFLLGLWVLLRLAAAHTGFRARRRLYALGDPINPMDIHFLNKRIFLQRFVPPAGVAVEGKTFEQCEIIGPINIIPIRTTIEGCEFITTDHVVIDVNALAERRVRNGQLFDRCRFINCKFFYVTILVNDRAWESHDRAGGCNWITLLPVVEPELPLPHEEPVIHHESS